MKLLKTYSKIMEFFRKAGIGIMVGIALLQLSVLGLIHLRNMPTTETLTQGSEQVITLQSRSLTSIENPIEGLYNHSETFYSETLNADFDFTSVGLSWQAKLPAGSRVEANIRFYQDFKWSEWLELAEEPDALIEQGFYAMASTDSAQAFQYKFTLYSNTEQSPTVKDIEWTFIHSVPQLTVAEAPVPQYYSHPILSSITQRKMSNPSDQIVSRQQWGANESYRYLADGEEVNLIERDEEFYQKFKDELQYSRIIEQDQQGNRYIWPLQYPEEVNKIIVHHTATTKNLDDPAQAIRDIYQFHAVSRGWGDIGYNYIIDQQGKIYEGRYGGEGVIGAHAGPGNHGSIGVAILGNYEDNPVPEQAINSLSELLYKKGRIHGIALDENSQFRGENMPNIFAHRDIMSTGCPGHNLYQKLPLVRTLSTNAFVEKEKFVTDYDFQERSELYYIELLPNQTQNFTLELENIGTEVWNNKTFLKLNVNPEFASTLHFPGKTGLILAEMKEENVDPGEIAHFDFTLEAQAVGKTLYMNLDPKINGSIDLEDQVNIAVTVQEPVYSYEVVEFEYPPSLMEAGDTHNGSVTIKNTGNVIWQNISLGGGTKSFQIKPGEEVKLSYQYTAPAQPGLQSANLTPEVPGAIWSRNNALTFETLVHKSGYYGVTTSKTSFNKWEKGESYSITIKVKNLGIEAWNKGDFTGHIITDSTGITFHDLRVSPSRIGMGETATITLEARVGQDAQSSSRNIIANLRVKDNLITPPVIMSYTLADSTVETLASQDNQIRIKLGFQGEPTITANGNFAVYDGDNFLRNLETGESYEVSKDELVLFDSEMIRFIPKDGAIMEITNYENRPAWNTDLNDNRYHGILEVRTVDGELVVINELPIEDYLKGLGEVSNTELPEKIKAIILAARSYAKYYTDLDEKFPGKPYHLDDNPDVSQKYLGYGLELRSPNVSQGVDATAGEVITYNGVVLKAPYFNQSDGVATKSAEEVWGWTDTPYLVSVSDETCDGATFLGHGVGMSGCGAKGMALNGADYKEILKHYYTGIEITKLY